MLRWHIFISTKGRGPHKQRTWRHISADRELAERTTLVVTPEEYPDFFHAQRQHGFRLYRLPDYVIGLSACRQYISDHLYDVGFAPVFDERDIDVAVFMDDDLGFYYRELSSPYGGWVMADPNTLNTMIRNMVRTMITDDTVGAVGIVPYKTDSHSSSGISNKGEIMRCFAVHNTMFELGARFDNTRLLQDFDLNCQIRKLGYQVLRLESYACEDDGPVNAVDGGVSVYRTPIELIRTVGRLWREYPDEIKAIIGGL